MEVMSVVLLARCICTPHGQPKSPCKPSCVAHLGVLCSWVQAQRKGQPAVFTPTEKSVGQGKGWSMQK